MSTNMNTSVSYSATDNASYQHAVLLVGRILIALLFTYFGYLKLTNWGGSVGYFTKWGFSEMPVVAAALAVIFELGGGILLIIGWKTRWVAWALFVYVIVATLIVHKFWTYEPAQVFNQTSHFFKNVSIMGGLLLLAAVGPGRYSVDKV